MARFTRLSSQVHTGSVFIDPTASETLLHVRQIGNLERWSVYAGDRPAFATIFHSLDDAEAALQRAA